MYYLICYFIVVSVNYYAIVVIKIASLLLLKLRHSRVLVGAGQYTRGPRVTRGRPVAYTHSGGGERGPRVTRGRPVAYTHSGGGERGPRVTRGRPVGYTHSGGWGKGKMTSKTRMARGKGAPRGRRVEKSTNSPANTTNNGY